MREGRLEGALPFSRMVKEGLNQKVMFEQNLKEERNNPCR